MYQITLTIFAILGANAWLNVMNHLIKGRMSNVSFLFFFAISMTVIAILYEDRIQAHEDKLDRIKNNLVNKLYQ